MPPSTPRPAAPTPAASATRIDQALAASAPLAHLQALLRVSNERFEAIRPLLPAGLGDQVRPGPVDDAGWCLLAANTAVAAKLRQLLPRLEQALLERDGKPSAIRVRVQSGARR